MRHERPTTEQTKQALDKIVKQVAYEMDVSTDYLYAILAGFKADFYAHFRPLFRAVCRVSLVRAKIWLDDLSAIYTAEAHRQRLSTPAIAFHGHPTECRKECREASDASIDGRSREVQIREHYEALEAHSARLAVLTDPDGDAEDASIFGGPREVKAG